MLRAKLGRSGSVSRNGLTVPEIRRFQSVFGFTGPPKSRINRQIGISIDIKYRKRAYLFRSAVTPIQAWPNRP